MFNLEKLACFVKDTVEVNVIELKIWIIHQTPNEIEIYLTFGYGARIVEFCEQNIWGVINSWHCPFKLLFKKKLTNIWTWNRGRILYYNSTVWAGVVCRAKDDKRVRLRPLQITH